MVENYGRYGYLTADNSVYTFQVGGDSIQDMLGGIDERIFRPSLRDGHLVQVGKYRVLTRGHNDTQIEEISRDIKSNRLMPEVIEKQIKIMFGLGVHVYKVEFDDNGHLIRKWVNCPEIMDWLKSWEDNGVTDDYNDFALSCVRRYYYFEDYFVKWHFFRGKSIGKMPVAALELVDNSRVRLATEKELSPFGNFEYDDFTHVMVGDWRYRGEFKVYPKFKVRDIVKYSVAISHHANDDIDSIYGRSKSYDGIREWLRAANENPKFIRSFLRNAMAAKMHIIIPNDWVESKKSQIKSLCEYNRNLQKSNKECVKFNGIEIGSEYNDAILMRYINVELERLTSYLSGSGNQGKLFSTFSFQDKNGQEVRWKIEQVDLKYKEYIESLLAFDRRADEVLLSAKGIDPSISNVSKEGVISKSGSDALYNYIIYLLQLPAPEKICCDALNMAVRANFPHLWAQGYMLGFYRQVPEKQENISPSNRLKNNE